MSGSGSAASTSRSRGHRLATRYALLVFLVTGLVLTLSAVVSGWFIWQQQRALVAAVQGERVAAAAARIRFFVEDIEARLRWMLAEPWLMQDIEDRQIDAQRQMRAALAISELAWIEADGREAFHVSRIGEDRGVGARNWAGVPEFVEARAKGIAFGPVYFFDQSEPYVRVAMAGQGSEAGVVLAVVNLKNIWDIITGIRVGDSGRAYVVDGSGRLIAHPDIAQVLKNTTLTRLDQVQAALKPGAPRHQHGPEPVTDMTEASVLAATYRLPRPDWVVVAELPVREAFAPVFLALRINLAVLGIGLTLAVLASLLMARRMVEPIRTLQTGAARIGEGALDHRIEVRTQDELGDLGFRFNAMAESLQNSYATLENRVQERTAELAEANEAKSRFFAAASHDLRQPLHALALYFGQMREEGSRAGRALIAGKLERAIDTMNSLFDALLDMSRLNSGVVEPEITAFCLQDVFDRMEAGFRLEAEQKGLALTIEPCALRVESDPLLLERCLRNLISNAIRYTDHGSVTLAAGIDGERLTISIADTGIGMSGEQQGKVFDEFYRAAGSRHAQGGFGLGLSIVHRLAALMGIAVSLESKPGLGTVFRLALPPAAILPGKPPTERIAPPVVAGIAFGRDRRALVVDDDPDALEALEALLETWGFGVRAARAASPDLVGEARFDLVIADYHLGEATGLEFLTRRRQAAPGDGVMIVISGSREAGIRRQVRDAGFLFLQKPLQPLVLRRMILDAFRQPEASTALLRAGASEG